MWHNSGLKAETKPANTSHYVTTGHDGYISKYTPRQHLGNNHDIRPDDFRRSPHHILPEWCFWEISQSSKHFVERFQAICGKSQSENQTTCEELASQAGRPFRYLESSMTVKMDTAKRPWRSKSLQKIKCKTFFLNWNPVLPSQYEEIASPVNWKRPVAKIRVCTFTFTIWMPN